MAWLCCISANKEPAKKFKPLDNATLPQHQESADAFVESLPVSNTTYHQYPLSMSIDVQRKPNKYVTVAASAPKSPKGAPDDKDYHHGRITRERAEHLLKRSQGPEGTFLVRESNDNVSTDSTTVYVLSILVSGTVAHIEMKRDESGKYYLKDIPGSKAFLSIPKVILHYQYKPLDVYDLGTVKLCCYIPVSDSEQICNFIHL